MRLQTDKWKEFLLGDLFDICAGIYHYPEEYEEGLTPYVSASNENNGISQYINLPPDFIGNCIVTGKVGCTAFYQSDDFCATSDVNILRAKNFTLNKNIALFIVSVINVSENYKWNYGRQCRVGDSKEIVVKLPILYDDKTDYPIIDYNSRFSEKGYVPDFYIMELYIDSLHSKMISTKNPN